MAESGHKAGRGHSRDNFAGAYPQGSFAVGDAGLQSDCDFLIPVHEPITAAQEAAVSRDRLCTWTDFSIAWTQRYAVTTFCRILHTLDSGQVTSEKAALLWATDHLGGRWSGLIQQVLDDRPLGWDAGRPPREGSVGQTLAFAEYAVAVATSRPGS